MNGMNFVLGVGDGSARKPGAQAPRGERVRSFALAARATLEVIGFLSVLIVAALALSPGLRSTVGELGADLWAYFGDASTDGVGEDADAVAVSEQRVERPPVLGPAANNVVNYLAHRYHVAEGAVRMVVGAAQTAGKERQIDPLLILSVVAVESSLNPFAQSPVGATGLMQVMPGLHSAKFLNQDASRGALDPVANIRVGSEILGDLIRRGGSVERGLQLYVGAGNAGDDGGYANRVLVELARLRMAAGGEVAAALAAALRADAHPSSEPADRDVGALPGEPAQGGAHRPDPA
jgi:hypothetical protein